MSEQGARRWQALAEREALGEAISLEDADFLRAYAASDPEAAAERAAWAGLLDALAAPTRIDADADADDALVAGILGAYRAQAGRSGAAAPSASAGDPAAAGPNLGAPSAGPPAAEAVAAPLVELHRASARPRSIAATAAAALAIAAALALIILPDRTDPDGAPEGPRSAAGGAPQAPSVTPPPAVEAPRQAPVDPVTGPQAPADEVLIALASRPGAAARGDLALDGEAAAAGAFVPEGATITSEGDTCLVFRTPPFASVCLGPGSVATLREARGGRRSFDLARGALVATLDPIPSGGAFTVTTADGEARAVGTIFAVRVADGATDVGVVEGEIAMRRPSAGAVHPLRAGEHATLAAPDRVAPLPADMRTWSMGHAMMADLWRALEAPTLLGLGPTSATLTLDHQRLIGGEIELLVEAGRHTLEVAGPRGVRARTIVGDPARPTLLSAAELRPSPRPGSSSEPGPASAGPSIAELRDRASDARATLQWRLAAESYEALITRYPGSPEAQNARVQLGDLLRARLGQPARALVYFEAYLQGGGPLAAEARVGRVLALQQLGRRDDEAAAIADYLDHHPDHIEASKLRQRQRELAGP